MQREVVKWIQSLDLSYPVHNPRRDLSNGFTVAQILSRYDKEVSMHSFDTGSSIARRHDNWQQIRKILKRVGCNTITEDMINGAIQQRENSAKNVVEALYCHLTKRSLKPNVLEEQRQAEAAIMPAYAKPTAAKVLRDANDPTLERFANLTGKTDELKLKIQNESKLEMHKVHVQATKFEDPDRFHHKSMVPENERNAKWAIADKKAMEKTMNTTAGAGGEHASPGSGKTPKVRQKLQIARQMAVRTLDDNILNAFAQRQEHEREESFKAQFDPNEDLSFALSRVVVRPLQTMGMVEGVDEYATAHAMGQPGSDYFAKFMMQRKVLPSDVRERVWAALLEAHANIAKHCNLRRDEFHHLVFGFDFLFKRDVARSSSESLDANSALDVDSAISLLTAVGSSWQKLDAESAQDTLMTTLAPSVIDALEVCSPYMMQRYVAILASFCNLRDIEAVKALHQVLVSSLGGPSDPKTAMISAHLLSHIDVDITLGGEELIEYVFCSLIAQPSVTQRIAAVHLLQRIAHVPHARNHFILPSDPETGNPTKSTPVLQALLAEPDWELRIVLLKCLCVMFLSATHAAATPSKNATDRRSLDEQKSFIANATLQCFDSLEVNTALVQQASLCVVAAFLNSEELPDLAIRFVRRLASLGIPTAVRTMNTSSGDIEAIHGKATGAFEAGGLSKLWEPTAVVNALVELRFELNSYELLTILEPLIQRVDLSENRDLWINACAMMRSDICDAVHNPANLRDVGEHSMSMCAELASTIATKVYSELAGEDEMYAEDDVEDEEDAWSRMRDRAVDWIAAL